MGPEAGTSLGRERDRLPLLDGLEAPLPEPGAGGVDLDLGVRVFAERGVGWIYAIDAVTPSEGFSMGGSAGCYCMQTRARRLPKMPGKFMRDCASAKQPPTKCSAPYPIVFSCGSHGGSRRLGRQQASARHGVPAARHSTPKS